MDDDDAPPPNVTLSTRFHSNPQHRVGEYGEELRAILSHEKAAAARSEIASWPSYAPTPLIGLGALARRLGIERIDYKDESGRFGLGSFKALGGAYAILQVLADRVGQETGQRPRAADLLASGHRDITSRLTVTCATDGNHGRSVAWGARSFGAACVVYVHSTVSDARVRAIEAFGAQVVRVGGNYDHAVHQADRDATAHGWIVISDTSYPGYMQIPRLVMQGYTVMVSEALDQMENASLPPPTHVFVQGGVGGLAAAVTAHLWEKLGASAPFATVVEPETAACLFESARAGHPVRVEGDLDTIMAGLACGEVSALAWQILAQGAGAFMTIPDPAAEEAMRLLASGNAGVRLVGGESGVAGLAGLLCLAARQEWRHTIGLGISARVLLIGSEGDTDPASYRRITGCSSDEVRKTT